jgi:predicted ABC-type transport system involved in lysophospholipase L1 biosynthesis ATPase subunit
MIEFQDVEGTHFRLEKAAVSGGEMAAVVAPTEACAREFVDLMLGLTGPRTGTVRLLGKPLAGLDEVGLRALRRRVGFASQAQGLVEHLALGENILLGASYHLGRDADALDARVRTLLGWCGWEEGQARATFQRRPETATPFERATAAWLRAALGDPELLVAEDLFAGLDPGERQRLVAACVMFQSENPARGSVFVLVGERLLEEIQPTCVLYLSLRGDFRSEN